MSLQINVLTGFLGSGKTTLLQRVLANEDMGQTALLINEFGEVGIDNLLVQEIAPNTILLPSGCVCCSVRGDLKQALIDLHGKRNRGEIPAFRRVLLETTGLADPAPILSTLQRDPQLRGRYHLGLLVTVVDAQHASLQERLHPEWIGQVTAADRLLVSKADLVTPESLDKVFAHLKTLNPTASVALTSSVLEGDEQLLGEGLRSMVPDEEVAGWQLFAPTKQPQHGNAQVCALEYEKPLDWLAFGIWLSMLLRCHGERILRVKGILNVIDTEQPIVIHGVQHCLHPPVHLTSWPNGQRRSRLVIIVRDLDIRILRRSFDTFLHSLGRAA
ncbi:putative GTP-binding protein YjiA [Pseudomonas fluorescens]|uniref:Cobalamin biosynthesis-related protein n=3 Tax=Pseudomonas TaxID=286 RepID=C3K7Q0_PSEFS|nr:MULTISPECIES: GTP-binding protein [Pseudomonas]MBZ6454856.1 GTP-binding protein [Pseudomonas fluorescens group sp.]MBZ6462044.1 GTP-binding protein [Pseudomonas fluorescens group sp.]MBZ6467428.1 GTP-binding protein [Pseudomonas fluorescens group sp.]QUE92583.1 GTP-binding protein [Pseudomonas sp. SCA2728.1_7]RMQ48482.1 putative cobalamin biosynthesis-related protein [Pseudomonas cichorii]